MISTMQELCYPVRASNDQGKLLSTDFKALFTVLFGSGYLTDFHLNNSFTG